MEKRNGKDNLNTRQSQIVIIMPQKAVFQKEEEQENLIIYEQNANEKSYGDTEHEKLKEKTCFKLAFFVIRTYSHYARCVLISHTFANKVEKTDQKTCKQ